MVKYKNGNLSKPLFLTLILAVLFALFIRNMAFAQTVEADFDATPMTSCKVPQTVFFTDKSFKPDLWKWDFGDGASSKAQNPIHTYVAPGEYNVKLTIVDTIYGLTDNITKTITISSLTADFTASKTFGCGPLEVNLTDQSTNDGVGSITNWEWDFGDGTGSTEQNPTHTYSAPGVYSVSLTVTNSNGCSNKLTKSSYVQVLGPDADFSPNVTSGCLPLVVTYSDKSNASSPIVSWSWDFGDGNTSNSPNPVHTYSEPGPFSVTLAVLDLDGCTSTKSYIDLINTDLILPTITCPGDQVVDMDANCQFTLPDYTGLATASDNCGTPTVTQSPAVGTIITSRQTITLTANDGSGNSAKCTFDVIPEDNTKPVITCPGDQVVDIDKDCQFTLPDYTSLATISDNCGTPTVSQSPAVGTIITSRQTITLTATDGSGNTNKCTFDIIPQDNTKPVIACPGDQVVDIDDDCQFILPDYTGLATISDNCGTPTVAQSPAAGTIITSRQTITLTATDGNGNTNQCTFDVIPKDNTKPVITCSGDQMADMDANCQFTLPDYTSLATVSDNCGTPTVSQSPDVGTIITSRQTITLTATDGSGNTSQCTFDVVPEDNTKPVITCPGDQVVDIDDNCQFTLPDYSGLATVSDNCGTPTVAQSPAVGTIITSRQTITLTAIDGSGNTSQCTFDVIPEDNTKPVITCPGDQMADMDANCQFTLPDYTSLATVSDNCGIPTVSQSPDVGTIITSRQTITLTATDGSGNTNQCTFDVIPKDNTKPVITCPGDQVVDMDANCQFTLPDYTSLATVSDNCGTPTVAQSPAAGTIITARQTITLTATDGSGNTSECSFEVRLQDKITPSIECPADIESCEETILFNNPTATDNCPDVTIELISGLPSGSTFPIGITSNTYEVTDKGGNKASCEFKINRLALPKVDAGPDLNLEAGLSVQIDATVNLPVSFEWSPTIGLDDATIEDPIAKPQQTTIYTLTVTTYDGCTASDEMTITVNEEIEINNFISPNGDGKNDAWEIKGNWLLDGCKVSVHNSWGDIIYESNGYGNNWYGTENGKDLPEGTYYYSISCPEAANRTGIIRLKR